MTIVAPYKEKSTINLFLMKIFTALFIGFVVTSPLNNSYEIAAMMNGTLAASALALGVPAWTAPLTPVYIKALKDVFFLFSAMLVVAGCVKSPKRARIFLTTPFIPLNLFAIIVILSAFYSLTFMPTEIVLMGIRGYWSLGLIYAGAFFYTFDERKLYPFIAAVFCFHFVLQIIQFATDMGFAVFFQHYRSPGLFIIASTAGAFALLVHYFAIRFHSIPLKIASILSLWMSNSTSGLFILIAYYIYAYRKTFRPKILFYPIYCITVLIAGYIMIANLGAVTGRGGGAAYSGLTRLALIYGAFSHLTSLIFGQGMGIATSQAYQSGYSNAVIADNTYLGILYNAGIVPALAMMVFVIGSFRYVANRLLYMLFLGYSMTTVIFELNPIIQIVLILLGMHIGRQYATHPAALKSRTSKPRPVPCNKPDGTPASFCPGNVVMHRG
jgi:hypothetical protein